MTQLLAVLAEPRRQEILKLVWDDERAAGNIAANIDITFGAVSQHLKLLRDAGAVIMTKRGRHHFYRADKRALGLLAQHLESIWHNQLLQLKHLAETEEHERG